MSIVTELGSEIARVRRIAEKMDPAGRDKALRSIRFAELAMQQVSIGDMYESLDELKEIKDPAAGPAAA